MCVCVCVCVHSRRKGSKDVPRRLDDGEKGAAPVLDVGDPNVVTSSGQPTTLLCEVSGTPAPAVKWTADGKSLDDESFLGVSFLVLADHALFIQDTSTKVCLPYLSQPPLTQTHPRHYYTRTLTLTFPPPPPPPPSQDEGRYLVTAENSSGTCQAQIKVTVIKASPPESESCDSHMICVCDQVIIM